MKTLHPNTLRALSYFNLAFDHCKTTIEHGTQEELDAALQALEEAAIDYIAARMGDADGR